MKPVVLDLENTTRNKGEGAVGSFSGSPYSTRNFIVLLAEFYDKRTHLTYNVRAEDWDESNVPFALRNAMEGNDTLMIGHNLSHDIAFLIRTWPEQWDKARPHLYIWDTQQVEYLLSGQTNLYPSLDDVSAKRGLPLKDDKIKQYWAQGVDTTDIPREELEEYGEQDVINPYYVFKDQWQELQDDPKLLELVRVKMDDILLTAHMQYYGMAFDLVFADEQVAALEKELEDIEKAIMETALPLVPEGFDFKASSPAHLSAVLFGGTLKMDVPMPVLDEEGEEQHYKSGAKKGQVKTRITRVEVPIKGLGLPTKGVPKTSHGFSTSDDVLRKLRDKADLPALIAKHREMSKDVSTYFKGYAALVWPDGAIHPSINHESTVTGRQSVSSPNLQNATKGED